ncbi:hypothetical protein MNEG_12982 [Monoraphidium neglectum]|uniref:Uncharacterized protein n=1 Tax=Monoraphidium neglectum TaxID=145388 RepID=A0A0D2M0B6_9CHLO|nr:hypothetical protein MNEG_12982 [Monoraphidium neglectum]KIY94981.1 hypothetical protein MNEG_12982 [Monoraphidium neglectum]|eukprot:XP_013894001.1 hypothetical protein MNEG_12982 [Monoraphidium neglectum]
MHPVSLPAPPPRPHSAAPAALQPKQAAPHGCDSAQPQPGAAGRGPQRQGDTAPGQPLGGRPGGDGPHAQQLRERAARLVAGAFASARGGGGGGPGAAVGGAMAEGMRRQLCDDAMTMLVLWATRQDYDAAVEALLNEWAGILGISAEVMAEKVDLAMTCNLRKPVLNRYASAGGGGGGGGGGVAAVAAPAAPTAAALGGGVGYSGYEPAAGGGGEGVGAKRMHSGDIGGGSKKAKQASASNDLSMFEGVTRQEAMVGRKGDAQAAGGATAAAVKRYWPADAAKNKGDPWFNAVVTDYDPVQKVHVLTYSLGTQREEREDIDISKLHQGSIDM